MSNRVAWGIATACVGLSGYLGTAVNHQNITSNIDRSKPGQQIIQFRQQDPELGKFSSFAATIGVMFCLYKATEPSEKSSKQSSKKTEKSFSDPAESSSEVPVTKIENNSEEPLEDSESEIEYTADNFTYEPEVAAESKSVSQQSEKNIFELIFKSTKKHCLIPAETGSGKTSFLLGFMAHVHAATKGDCEFYGSTAKPGSWGGLDKVKADDGHSHVINLSPTNPSTIVPLINRLNWLVKKMEHRQKIRQQCEETGRDYNPTPIYIVIDEWLGTIAVAERYDNQMNAAKERNEPRSNILQTLIDLVELIIIIGREDNVAILLFGQDHQVQNCRLNGGYQRSLNLIVPFRKGATNSIKAVLTGKFRTVYGNEGLNLWKQVQSNLESKPESAYVYLSLDSDEVLEVPYNPKIKSCKIWEPAKNPFDSNVVEFVR